MLQRWLGGGGRRRPEQTAGRGQKLEEEGAAGGLAGREGDPLRFGVAGPPSLSAQPFLSLSSLSLTGSLFIFLSRLWSFVSPCVCVTLPRPSVSSLSLCSPLHVSLPPRSFPAALSVSPNTAVTYLRRLSCWAPSLPVRM